MKELIKKCIPQWFLNFYHFILAFLGALVYLFPSRKLKIVGITGTNGKTTVAEMINKIFEEVGFKVALMNSIRFKIGGEEWLNTLRMTMPGRLRLQRFLRQAVNADCQYAVLEVTSEGIKQYRHKFIDFEVAVFTNLTPEHIEAHGSFKNYKKTKGKLFKATKKIHVINLDDENAEYFLQFSAKEKWGYTVKNPKSQVPNPKQIPNPKSQTTVAKNPQVSSEGIRFFINETEFSLRLLGEFNIYNSLAAICVGLSQGISLETCKKALEKVKDIPGRMEIVISEPFKVIVDYAFTPNALEKVYQTLKNNFNPKKMICVFGSCGGGRDKWKRPVLGEIAKKYCDEIIITNEDPYDEDPIEIINQVAAGVEKFSVNQFTPTPNFGVGANQRKSASIYKILDRREAINWALKIAQVGDVVVITGKGCEPCICAAGGKKIPWDDRKVVKEEFKKL